MIVRKVTCPVCGNDIRVNNTSEEQKCKFCRRCISVKFEARNSGGKKKYKVSVEALPFEQQSRPGYKIKNLSKFREGEIYGLRH